MFKLLAGALESPMDMQSAPLSHCHCHDVCLHDREKEKMALKRKAEAAAASELAEVNKVLAEYGY